MHFFIPTFEWMVDRASFPGYRLVAVKFNVPREAMPKPMCHTSCLLFVHKWHLEKRFLTSLFLFHPFFPNSNGTWGNAFGAELLSDSPWFCGADPF